MRVPTGSTDRYIYFVAVDPTDLQSREVGLSGFTVYGSLNGGTAATFTTPTVNETDATNMPGVYELLLDEQTTITAGNDTEELCLHITHASMEPVTRTIELYRPETTEGNTLGVAATGDVSGNIDGNVDGSVASVTAAVTVGTINANVITATSINADAITNAKIAADAIGATEIANGAIDAATFATGAIDAAAIAADAIDLIWDEPMAGHITADTSGLVMNDWQDGGRLDLILDARMAEASINTTGGAVDTVTTLTNLPAITANWLTATGINADAITAAKIANGAIDAATFAAGAIDATAIATGAIDADAVAADAIDLIWDEALSGHTTGGTTGKALNNAASFIVTDGTCQGTGQTTTNIRLAAGESATNDIYKNDEIIITGGLGAGESALITAYDGTNKDCTVSPALVITCDGTSTYEILPAHTHAENLGADAVDATAVATDAIDADSIAADAIDLIWDETLTSHVTADSAAVALKDVLADTNELQGDDVPGLIAALDDVTAAQVLTQVNTALDTAISELSQGAPTATPSLRTGLMLLYMALRNKTTVQTSGTDALEINNDAGTIICKKLLTDDGSDYSEAEMVSGP